MKPRSFQATQTVLPGDALGPSICVKGPSDDFGPSVFSELALGLSWAGDLLKFKSCFLCLSSRLHSPLSPSPVMWVPSVLGGPQGVVFFPLRCFYYEQVLHDLAWLHTCLKAAAMRSKELGFGLCQVLPRSRGSVTELRGGGFHFQISTFPHDTLGSVAADCEAWLRLYFD